MEQANNNKNGTSLLIKVLIGITLAFVLLIGGSVLFYYNCEKCQEVIGGIAEGAAAIQQGMSAPGAAEVRALGCEQAMVVEMRVFIDMVAPMVGDEEVSQADDDLLDTLMVSCTTGTFSKPSGPECEDVMRAYVTGAGEQARDTAFVAVQGSGAHEPYCQGLYAKDGSFLGGLE